MFKEWGKTALLLLIAVLLFPKAYSQSNISIRSDTVFLDTLINNKPHVFRKIIVYDTLWLTAKLPVRPHGLLSLKTHTPDFVRPQNTIEAPFKYKPWIEAGIHYYTIDRFYNKGLFENYHETFRNTNGFGAYTNIFFPYGNFYLRTGLDMSFSRSRINNDYKLAYYDSVPYTYDSIVIDTAYFLDTDQLPDTVYIMHVDTFSMTVNDTAQQVKYDTSMLNLTNRYFYLEMPFLLGYNFVLRPFEVALESGVYLTWLARVKGKVIDKAHFIRQLDENYFHRVNLDFAFRFRLKYNLSATKALTLTPGFRYSLFSIYRNDQVVARKNLRWGVALGYIFY